MRFDLSLARTLHIPVNVMRAVMPMSEYHAWRALALLEAQIAELVRGGTDPDTAERMVWALQTGDDDEG